LDLDLKNPHLTVSFKPSNVLSNILTNYGITYRNGRRPSIMVHPLIVRRQRWWLVVMCVLVSQHGFLVFRVQIRIIFIAEGNTVVLNFFNWFRCLSNQTMEKEHKLKKLLM
jgi:hypothetical protein